MAFTFVAAGTAANGNNSAGPLTPGLPAGWAVGDLLVVVFQCFGGTNSRVPSMPGTWSGGTWLNGTSSHGLWWKIAEAGEGTPSITLTGSGATGDTQVSRCYAFHHDEGSSRRFAVIAQSANHTNASADNIGVISGLVAADVPSGALVLLSGGKSNDWNGAATLTGWTSAGDNESTTGNDAASCLLYRLSAPGTDLTDLTITDNGGTASNGVGSAKMVSFTTELIPVLDDTGWVSGAQRSFVPVARALGAAALLTTQVALASGTGWLPDEIAIEAGTANVTPATTLQVVDRSVAAPVPWFWHQDELYVPPLTGEESPPPPAIVVPWKIPALPLWAGEADDHLPLPGDEGEAVLPRPLPPDLALAWLSAPTGGYAAEVPPEAVLGEDGWTAPPPAPWLVRALPPVDEDGIAPTIALGDDEGTYFVVPVGPAYILLPPPSGGSAPEPITSIAGAEGEYRPVPPPLPRPVPVPPGEDGDWATPPATLAGDEGEAPSQPVAPWLARPAPIWDEDGYPTAPAPLVEDEGTYFVMPVGPTYVLLPPPSGGSAPTTEVGTPIGVDEDGGEVVRRLTAARPLFTDPTFFVVVGDDVVAPLDEDGYQPPVTVPWRAIGLPAWLWGTEDRVEPPASFGLSEDHFQPPLPRGLEFGLAWLSAETGGYAPSAAPDTTIHDGEYRPTVVVPWLAVQRPVDGAPDEAPPPAPALSEDAYAPPMAFGPEFSVAWFSGDCGDGGAAVPTPFGLDEDLDPEQLQRALPPVWKAVRPVWGFWDVDEARVTPVYPSGGQGTGRTHLFLGEIGDSRTVTSSAGALYVLSGGYGQSVGEATTLVLETPDIAPLGPQGRLRLRRIAVPFQYAAGCTVRVTPIVDYNTELDPVTVTHTDPTEVTRHVIQAKMMTACTVVRLRIEVTALAGAVEFYRPSLFFAPLSGGTTMAMGGAP